MPASKPPACRSVRPSAPPPKARAPLSIPPARAEELIAEHTPLVWKIAGRFLRRLPPHVLKSDVVGAGMGGLWEVIRRYWRNDRGAFIALASTRINGAILDELRAQDWFSRRARRKRYVSLVRIDDSDTGWDALLVSSEANAESEAALRRAAVSLFRSIGALPDREQKVLRDYYQNDRKIAEIANDLGVSEARVSQIHMRALGKLREIISQESDGNEWSTSRNATPSRHRR